MSNRVDALPLARKVLSTVDICPPGEFPTANIVYIFRQGCIYFSVVCGGGDVFPAEPHPPLVLLTTAPVESAVAQQSITCEGVSSVYEESRPEGESCV